jgi:hypothetical protein
VFDLGVGTARLDLVSAIRTHGPLIAAPLNLLPAVIRQRTGGPHVDLVGKRPQPFDPLSSQISGDRDLLVRHP